MLDGYKCKGNRKDTSNSKSVIVSGLLLSKKNSCWPKVSIKGGSLGVNLCVLYR